MLKPVHHNFTAYRGATFDTRLTFYTDKAQTERFDMSAYTSVLKIGNTSITEGNGVTTGGTDGVIDIRLGPEKTMIYSDEKYTLSITNGDDVHYILTGRFKFQQP